MCRQFRIVRDHEYGHFLFPVHMAQNFHNRLPGLTVQIARGFVREYDTRIVPLDSDTELRRAFFMLKDETVPGYAEYMAALDTEIEFSQNIFFPEIAPGIKPAPLSFSEILNAEAWLLAAKWKPL